MAEKFKIGDIVQLKSGGPAMTVTAVEGEGMIGEGVNTTWFAGRKRETGHFPLDALVIYKEEAKK